MSTGLGLRHATSYNHRRIGTTVNLTKAISEEPVDDIPHEAGALHAGRVGPPLVWRCKAISYNRQTQ